MFHYDDAIEAAAEATDFADVLAMDLEAEMGEGTAMSLLDDIEGEVTNSLAPSQDQLDWERVSAERYEEFGTL